MKKEAAEEKKMYDTGEQNIFIIAEKQKEKNRERESEKERRKDRCGDVNNNSV